MGVDDVASGGAKIVKALIPPVDNPKRWRYDLTVSAVILFGGLLVTLHILWICGWLTFLSITPPFARADDMKDAQIRLMSVQRDGMDARLRDAKTKVCLAIQAKNQTALDAWARILEGLKQQYRDQINREPYVMGCDELLIGGPPTQPQ